MLKPPLTPEQWAQARRLRDGGATFAAIGVEVGAHPSTIASRARKEGWPRPPGLPALASRSDAIPQPADTADIHRGLMHRVYRVMDLKLEMMELRMKKQVKEARKGGEIPVTDDEKDMRPLTTVVKTIEQSKELAPDRHRIADGGTTASNAAAAASEADAFRREIAERLEKLIPPS